MKTSKTMQAIITKIAAKHGLDLTRSGGHLKLTMPNYLPLVIETLPGNQISIAHYYEQNGDAMRDPEVVFYYYQHEVCPAWYAIEITQDPVGCYRRPVEIDYDSEGFRARFNAAGQADLAAFVRIWAKNIRQQRWLQYGEVA